MEESYPGRYLARQACTACKSKKRKCDKTLPACLRCQRVSNPCHYPDTTESPDQESGPSSQGSTWRFKHVNVPSDAESSTPSRELQGSNAACKRCREGKRSCSRSLPHCSRCERAGVQCVYDLSLLRSLRMLQHQSSDSDSDSSAMTDRSRPACSTPPTGLLTIDHNGHAQLDPFQTYPSSLGPDCDEDAAIREMWPQLFPGFVYKGESFVHHWMKSAMDCPPLFNAWLHSGAEHMQLREQGQGNSNNTINRGLLPGRERENYEMLLMEREAILGLKEFVERGCPEDVTDEIIMSALALALHPPERKRSATLRMRWAPLANLQWLSRFTDIVISEGHVHGLRHLVQLRGGFDNLEMPGLKEGLATFDLVVASKYLTRPFWPLRTRIQPSEVARYLGTFQRPRSAVEKGLQSRVKSVFPRSINWEFSSISGYSVLLESYSRGLLPDLDMRYVLELRNMIHYRTMSLPSPTEMVGMDHELSPIYGACRLGLIAYSLLTLFPVPLTTEPYPKLACLLRGELELTQMNLDIWMPAVEMLLWVLSVGGIAALGTEHRSWFAGQLRWLVGIMEVDSWEHFKTIMSAVVWLDTPCDAEGLILWGEVQELAHIDPNLEPMFPVSYT